MYVSQRGGLVQLGLRDDQRREPARRGKLWDVAATSARPRALTALTAAASRAIRRTATSSAGRKAARLPLAPDTVAAPRPKLAVPSTRRQAAAPAVPKNRTFATTRRLRGAVRRLVLVTLQTPAPTPADAAHLATRAARPKRIACERRIDGKYPLTRSRHTALDIR